MSGLSLAILSKHDRRCRCSLVPPIRSDPTLVSVNVTVTGPENPSCLASKAFWIDSRTELGNRGIAEIRARGIVDVVDSTTPRGKSPSRA